MRKALFILHKKNNPNIGTPLNSKYDGLDTNIRFLIVSKQLIIMKYTRK